MIGLASVDAIERKARSAWKPPPRLTLSQWADQHFYLSAESAAEPGKWKTLPYQKGIMDAVTDPAVEKISVMKSARVGYTKIINATVGYHIHQSPCPIMVVQPSEGDAEGYSKEEIAPMLHDCPVVGALVIDEDEDAKPRTKRNRKKRHKGSDNTILHKRFPGGVLGIVGAHSGAGFRRVSRKVVIFDEVDGYPASAGSDGDQIKLGTKRAEFYHDRKIIAGSTPLVAGVSRIEQLFEAGDQRRYFVPCPSCGHMAPLVFEGDKGHAMKWPDGKPADAYFVCQKNGCVIEHKEKRAMVAAGEWRASAPFSGHASFHIWAAYSYAPNASWRQLAEEWIDAQGNPEKLKTFINTVLGETWKDRGEAPDWERLHDRCEDYEIGTVPEGVSFLTAGVDVQKDRFVYEVVGWGAGKESWSIDAGVIPGDTSTAATWSKLDDLLAQTYPDASGVSWALKRLAIDSGYNTSVVYAWARKHVGHVLAVKGVKTAKTLLGTPTAVDAKPNGKRVARGCKMWPVSGDIAKHELYGWLKLKRPAAGDPYPDGWMHFPAHGEDYFKQLTAEQLVVSHDRRGYARQEWNVIPGRENHFLDTRVYARAAAANVGIDRRARRRPKVKVPSIVSDAVATVAVDAPASPPPKPPRPRKPKRQGFLSGGGDRNGRRGTGWL